MKKAFAALLIALVFNLSACSKNTEAVKYISSSPNAVSTIAPDPFKKEIYYGPPSAADPSLKHYSDFEFSGNTEFIDYDMSKSSKTVVYGFLYDVLANPEKYLGKFIRLPGIYMPYKADDGSIYHVLTVYDEAACCEMAIEMLPAKGSDIAFPEPGGKIEAKGLIDICNDSGTRFVALRIDDINIIE